MIDIMLDLETLALDNNATVVSIGAVQFDLKTGEIGKIFEIGIDPLEQVLNGSKVDQSTLDWWSSQSGEAKEKLTKLDTVKLKPALNKFNEWIKINFENTKKVRMWGNGIAADNVWIRNLYKRSDISFILPYWCDNDVRTLVQLVDYDKVKELTGEFIGVKHDAIDDCKHQIKMCTNALSIASRGYVK